MASEPLELAWLHHEFCKFLIDIRRFDLARFYAKKGRDMAQEAKCNQWVLNVDHLVLRMEIYQNNRSEAKDATMLALACARKLDIDYLVKIRFSQFREYLLVIAPLYYSRIYFTIDTLIAYYLKLVRRAREKISENRQRIKSVRRYSQQFALIFRFFQCNSRFCDLNFLADNV